jgi:hypothetical protein
MIGYEDMRYNSASVGLLEASPRGGSGTFLNCECAGVPSGAVVRVVPVLFVRDSIPE